MTASTFYSYVEILTLKIEVFIIMQPNIRAKEAFFSKFL